MIGYSFYQVPWYIFLKGLDFTKDESANLLFEYNKIFIVVNYILYLYIPVCIDI